MKLTVNILGLLLILLTVPLQAQIVRGSLVSTDGNVPVGRIVVVAVDSGGKTVMRTLSNERGQYVLNIGRPGRFAISALRVGFLPTILPPLVLFASEVRVLDIQLSGAVVPMATITVSDKDNCGMKGDDAATWLSLWEQARTAIAATRLSEAGDSLLTRMQLLAGTQDRPGNRKFHVVGPINARSAHIKFDSAQGREVIGSHVFAETPPETLAVGGYVRARPGNAVVFDAPNAEVLLSDSFAGSHCFSMERASKDAPNDMLGIHFKPIADVDTLADLEGTVWLAAASSELHRLDFSYTNLKYFPTVVCGPRGGCQHIGSAYGSGGSIVFKQLSSGEWVVSEWMIRTPASTYEYRNSGTKMRQVNGKLEECYRGRDCDVLLVPIARLEVYSGAIASVTRGGVELYRNEITINGIARMASSQAGKHPSRVVGSVSDTTGRPIEGVVISTVAPARATATSADGRFELTQLRPGSAVVRVKKRGFEPVEFQLQLVPDSSKTVEFTLRRAGRTPLPRS